jgi:hypothetical protein
MRHWSLAFVTAFLTLCGACQKPNEAVTAHPTTDELLTIQMTEFTPTQATVAVEGRAFESQHVLLSEFKPPELTAEEKAALGPERVWYKFLPYSDLRLPVGSKVAPWIGGVETAVNGRGGALTWIAPPERRAGVSGSGGVNIGVDPVALRIVGVGHERPSTGVVGPPNDAVIATDPLPKKVAEKAPSRER